MDFTKKNYLVQKVKVSQTKTTWQRQLAWLWLIPLSGSEDP